MIRKVVLITGAGRGLGKAIAQAYHAIGFHVIATDVNIDLLEAYPVNYRYTSLQLNVSSEADVRQASEKIIVKYNKIDVVVSNAGIFDFYPVSEAGASTFQKILEVNVLGLLNLTKYFLSPLLKAKGRLVVIGSESYKVPSPFQPYSVSKQMLESVFRSIKIEFSLVGIKCILIRPGAMQTQIIDDTIQFNKSFSDSKFEKEFDGFVKTVPKYIGKIVQPEKVAGFVLKAGTAKKPKAIYQVNHNPLVGLLSLLPQGLVNIIIKRNLKK